MTWWARVRTWLRVVARRSQLERDMDAELRFHIESYADDLVRSGVPREEAGRRARLEFGAIDSKKDDCRAVLGVRIVDELRADIRYGARVLRKSPGFTFVAVSTLALGIGANTAMFTLLDAVMLRLMPVHDAARLYQVQRATSSGPGRTDGAFTNALWENLRDRQDVFSATAAWGNTTFNLAQGGAVQEAQGLWVSGNYFGTLEIAPAIGRLIASADDYRGCPGVVVLSHAFWQERYGGADSAIGGTISLNSHSFQIVGVAARGFHGVDVGQTFDVAAPNCATALLDGTRSRLDARSWWWLSIIGRLTAGLSAQQMNARLAAISQAVAAPAVPHDWDDRYRTPFLQAKLVGVPAGGGISYSFRQTFQQPLAILMAVAGAVLLIACANVASLMLARGAAQTREIGVRLALGAGRMRLVRQFLTHALMLSITGAAAGVLLARWGTALLVHAISTQRDRVFLDLSPDWRVAGFTAGVALLTSVVFGVLPALRTTRVPLTGAMRGPGAEGLHEGKRGLRTWIAASQIALSVALLVTAGLCLRSFVKLVRLDPGFDKHNVLLVAANLKPTSIKAERHPATFDAIEARLATLPGVVAVGRSHEVPLSGGGWNDEVRTDSPTTPSGDSDSLTNFVSPGYFTAMRIALRGGRDFTTTDTATAGGVAIVNQAFARKFFGSTDPIGHTIHVDKTSGEPGPPIRIVGTVADAKYMSLRENMRATAFFPITQIPEPDPEDTFAIRTAVVPHSLIGATEAAVAAVSRDIPLTFTTLERRVDDAMVQERLLAMLSAFFGAMALLLAVIGLYGTISYRVTLRRPEFGIRLALGAPSGSIVRMVVGEVAAILLAGAGAGIGLALVTTTALQKQLFGLGPRDPATIATAALLLWAVALAAAYVPARRAARVEPMTALRCE